MRPYRPAVALCFLLEACAPAPAFAQHAAADADSPGDLALRVHGWFQANLLFFPDARPHEASDVLSPTGFPTGSTTAHRGRFHASARDSRLRVDARTPASTGRWRAVAEFDFFGRTVRSYDPRVRHAYVEWEADDARWRIRSGQDWSAFADPAAYAALYNPLPPGAVFVRQPQLRVAWRGAGDVTLAASLERARGDVASAGGSLLRGPVGATPDLAMAARIERRRGAMQWGALLRDGAGARAAGWGVSASGRLELAVLPRSAVLRFQAAYGAGIARYIGEFGPGFERLADDRARAANVDARGERVFAANVSGERRFTQRLSATVAVGIARAYDAPSIDDRTVVTVGGNLVFHPASHTELALEYLAMSRRDGAQPRESRDVLRLSARLHF